MDLSSKLFFFGLFWICTGSVQESCKDYGVQFQRVFSVPGDAAMLSCTLVAPDVFNFTSVPYNITWYDPKTNRQLTNRTAQVLVHGETLWFLNLTLDHGGEYVSILRTPSNCYRQATELIVDQPAAGECGKPQKANQQVSSGTTDWLSCPLGAYVTKLNSYSIPSSIKWYRGCDLLEDGTGSYSFWDDLKLKIEPVDMRHSGNYTCTLNFTLDGFAGSVSESITAWVSEEYSLVPQVRKPANETIKAEMGSNFTKQCLVFVPCVGEPMVDVFWKVRDSFIFTTNSLDRVYTSEKRSWIDDDGPVKGVWMERLLMFSELRDEDFHTNYTCQVHSDRGLLHGYFTLLPTDPSIIKPIGAVLGGATVLFILSVTVFYLFKVDIVLSFRRAFPIFYPNTDGDGKLYDAYVAYPQSCGVAFSEEVDTFALHTLPQVLEKACGYKLFIAGRDCQPGQAAVDSVDENMRASRQLLLLYTASTFTSRRLTGSISGHNNNNISKSSEGVESRTSDSSSSLSSDGGDGVCTDPRQQLEWLMAIHRTLLEGSLKVVLVELEEVTPAQLALFPESVRHLRRKQGAVCWWKNQRTRWRRTHVGQEDKETGGQDANLSPSLSPSSRFWKEMRYHMPVRGKKVVYPEKTALLHL